MEKALDVVLVTSQREPPGAIKVLFAWQGCLAPGGLKATMLSRIR
jgi:hypothetical protein